MTVVLESMCRDHECPSRLTCWRFMAPPTGGWVDIDVTDGRKTVMGLDCSHGAFHGAYTAFNRLRQAVCKATGGSFPPHDDATLDGNYWYFGDKYSTETNPGLREFLSHSDCDGEISPDMCVVVANELEELLPKIQDIPDGGHIGRQGGFVAVITKFIVGCRNAASAGEPLTFG